MGIWSRLFGGGLHTEVVEEPLRKADDDPSVRSGTIVSKTETSDVSEAGGFSNYEDLYALHVWTYACIYQIASRIARIPAVIAKRRDDWSKPVEPVEDRDAAWLGRIISSPNDDTTWYDLIEATVSYLELTGNAFWEWGFPGNGGPDETPSKAWDLRSDRMTINPGTDRRVDSFTYKKDDTDEKDLETWRVAHFRYFHPKNEQSGLSPTQPASSSVTTDLWAIGVMNDFFHHGAVPDAVVSFPRELSDKAFKRFTSMFKNKYVGVGRMRKTMFLDGDARYTPVQKTPNEAGMIEVRKASREDVLACYGVPPVAVGILEHASYANAMQQMVELYDGTLLPKIMKIYGVLNRQMHRFKETKGLDIVPDLSSIQHLMREHQVNMERRKLGMEEVREGAITVNEYRAEFLGKKPVPWGHEWWPPMNRMPASAVPTEPTDEGAGDEDDE